MRIWHGIDRLPATRRRVVASIGNYDGIHLGHQAILTSLIDAGRRHGTPSMLISFEPHPLEIVAPERRPALLQTRRQQIDCLEALGLDEFLLVDFTPELALQDGAAFVRDVLEPRLRFEAIHVGGDFRFGRGRSGDVALLRRVAERDGFEVCGLDEVTVDGEPVSSTRIRRAIRGGDVETAARLLGRPYAIEGEVVRGDGRGRELGFPTANLDIDNEIAPGAGVYVTEAVALAGRHSSLTNIGVRPTFGGRRLTVECHLLGCSEDLYGERMEVRFLARVRDEMRFESRADLADQIARDRAAAESYFEHQPIRAT